MERTLSVGATAGVMRGMRGVVFGVANNRSIAWGIASAMHREGAQLAQGQIHFTISSINEFISIES